MESGFALFSIIFSNSSIFHNIFKYTVADPEGVQGVR